MNIQKKLEEFEALEDGWHYNEGVKFDKQVLDISKNISDFCVSNGYDDQEIFPGISGDILLSLYNNGEDEIEIQIDEKLNFIYLYFSEAEEDYIDKYDCETTNLETLKEHIIKIKEILEGK